MFCLSFTKKLGLSATYILRLIGLGVCVLRCFYLMIFKVKKFMKVILKYKIDCVLW